MPDGATSLPDFDPALHLTAADLRDLERRHGYEQTAMAAAKNPGGPGHASLMKIQKTGFETRLFMNACVRFAALSREHPPYGLPLPLAQPALILAERPQHLDVNYLDEASSPQSLKMISINALHSLSDMKMQLLINELLLGAQLGDDYRLSLPAGQEAAKIASNGRTDNWKFTIQSAASNAKRSGFIMLKQVLLQWVSAHGGHMPTRTQFLEAAHASQDLLETLATTHLAVFKTLNGRIIADASGKRYHRMAVREGRPQIALDKSVLANLNPEKGYPPVRTMCAALLAREAGGPSLLEMSYREDAAMVADMHFDGEEAIPETVLRTLNSKLPDPSVHMYLKLRAFTPGGS